VMLLELRSYLKFPAAHLLLTVLAPQMLRECTYEGIPDLIILHDWAVIPPSLSIQGCLPRRHSDLHVVLHQQQTD
jgi:hypothetical protein